MAHITAFVSNRGGIGKSSLCAQLAPAVALAAPGRDVLLVDMSIQGDASTYLLGGVAEPTQATSGARTRGGEALAALAADKGVTAFVRAALLARAPPPAAAAAAEQRPSFWRGVVTAAPPPPTPPPPPSVDWKAHAVRPLDVHPAGNAPPNLWLLAGGKDLFGLPFEGGVAPALRAALKASGALVLVDTDAELSERGASLAGIAAADELALVVSTSWADYLRALDDPANSLMAALAHLGTHPDTAFLAPRIAHVYFNCVQKRLAAPGGLAALTLPFTPPQSALDAMADICAHLCSVARAGRERHFVGSLDTPEDFMRRYVTAVPTVPDAAWAAAALKGQPLVCDPADQAAATHVRAAAARLLR